MKISIASHGVYPLSIGGMERHTYNLAKSLAKRGEQVEVIIPKTSHNVDFPFPIVEIPWPKRPLWLWENYAFSKHVFDYLKKSRPDVVLSQGYAVWAGLKKLDVPVIFHPHGLEAFGAHMTSWEKLRLTPFRWVTGYHARHSQKVISLGGKLTDILRDQVKLAHDHIAEIPNAVFPGQFEPKKNVVRKPRSFLFLGRLAFNKGIDFLPNILKRLKDIDFTLTIVGDGPGRPEVIMLSQADPRVKYHPFAQDLELLEHMHTHECLLFMSRFEGMPTVILEAMAAGMLVIATRIGAVESIFDNMSGVLSEPNPNGLAEAMRLILSMSDVEKQERRSLLTSKVHDQFSWDSVLNAYLDLFYKLKQGHG